jgi:hypothetical protein
MKSKTTKTESLYMKSGKGTGTRYRPVSEFHYPAADAIQHGVWVLISQPGSIGHTRIGNLEDIRMENAEAIRKAKEIVLTEDLCKELMKFCRDNATKGPGGLTVYYPSNYDQCQFLAKRILELADKKESEENNG